MRVALILGHPVKEAVAWKVCASGADEEDGPQRDCIINTLLNHSYANVIVEKRVYNTVITNGSLQVTTPVAEEIVNIPTL